MIVAQALYLIAPAVVAGICHGFAIKRNLAPALAKPLDGGRLLNGRPMLGANKTWRGLFVMSGVSTAVVFVQHALDGVPFFDRLAVLDYGAPSSLTVGLALGLGYSLAELPNSFVKRRLGIRAGQATGRLQYLADQADSVIGATLALTFFVRSPAVLALVVVTGLGLHVLIDELLYAFGVKRR